MSVRMRTSVREGRRDAVCELVGLLHSAWSFTAMLGQPDT